MFRSKDKPDLEKVTRLQTEIQKGREAFARRLSRERDVPSGSSDDAERRTGSLYELFTAYGAPIGRS